MPVAAEVGRLERNDHDVADSDVDVVVAPRAQVRLGRLVRLHPAYLDLVVDHPKRAHATRRAMTTIAAATMT